MTIDEGLDLYLDIQTNWATVHVHLTLFPQGNFHAYFVVCRLFSISTFRKILSGIPSDCQIDWIQIEPFICRAQSGSKLFAKVISR